MEDLRSIEAFVRAIELRSFTAAAKVLGITPSGIGKSITRLESSLGVRLLHRTTRRLALTDDGAVFFEQCRRILEELDLARSLISSRSAVPRGRLRVSAPITIGKRIVIPALSSFLSAHPEIELDLALSDRRVNLVEEGIDVAVRIGSLGDSSLVARPIGQQQLVTVAAKGLDGVGEIASLGDLAMHRCLTFRMLPTGRERPWTFRSEGREIQWRPRPFLTFEDGEALVAAARAGLGVTQVPSYIAEDALASGELVEVLSHMRPHPMPIHAVYASRRDLPARTRAFVDFLTSLEGLRPLPRPRGDAKPRRGSSGDARRRSTTSRA